MPHYCFQLITVTLCLHSTLSGPFISVSLFHRSLWFFKHTMSMQVTPVCTHTVELNRLQYAVLSQHQSATQAHIAHLCANTAELSLSQHIISTVTATVQQNNKSSCLFTWTNLTISSLYYCRQKTCTQATYGFPNPVTKGSA